MTTNRVYKKPWKYPKLQAFCEIAGQVLGISWLVICFFGVAVMMALSGR